MDEIASHAIFRATTGVPIGRNVAGIVLAESRRLYLRNHRVDLFDSVLDEGERGVNHVNRAAQAKIE